jgi:hypothetical protein
MKANKLSKEKRNKLILAWLVILAVTTGWVLVVFSGQQDAQTAAEQNLEKRKNEFGLMTDKLKRAEDIEAQQQVATQKLRALETSMANASDTFSWVVTTVREFKQAYPKVELPQFSPVTTGPVTLLPKFPYQQASVTVAGSAHYQDLGMFIAGFENQFPFARITNLEIEPAAVGAAVNREKLSFKMAIIFLVKPAQS